MICYLKYFFHKLFQEKISFLKDSSILKKQNKKIAIRNQEITTQLIDILLKSKVRIYPIKLYNILCDGISEECLLKQYYSC